MSDNKYMSIRPTSNGLKLLMIVEVSPGLTPPKPDHRHTSLPSLLSSVLTRHLPDDEG